MKCERADGLADGLAGVLVWLVVVWRVQAITDLHAERVGHGFHIFNASKCTKKSDPQQFVKVPHAPTHSPHPPACLPSKQPPPLTPRSVQLGAMSIINAL